MSIVSVTEVASGPRDSTATAGGRKHTRVFHVLSDDPDDGPWVARVAPGIPTYGLAHPDDMYAFVSSVHAKHVDDDPLFFKVVVKYGTPDTGGGGGESPPLEQIATIEANSEHVKEETTEDVDGVSITNSCGELYSGVMVDVTYVSMVATQYEATYSLADALFYSDRVNSEPWEGLTANQGKLSDIRGRWIQEFGIWQVSYTIKVNWFGWNERLIDRGFQHYRYTSGDPSKERDNNKDSDGHDVMKPLNLDGNGNIQADGIALKYRPDNDDPTKLFKKYRELNFALIGIRFPWA